LPTGPLDGIVDSVYSHAMAERDMKGIEKRFDANGCEEFRGYLPHPDNRNRKLRGPWTYSYSEAKGWRVRMLAKKLDGVPLVAQPALPLVRVSSESFLEGAESGLILSRKREPYAPKTIRGYRQAFRDWINPEVGDETVDVLKRSQVQLLVDTVSALRAGGTTRNVFHALAALYTYLLPRHDELADPTAGIILPRPGKPRSRYSEPEEMAALIEALPEDMQLPYVLAFYEGCRKAEIQAMPADAVNLAEGWIDIGWGLDPVAGFKGPKSYAGKRPVPIFDAARPYLERALEKLHSRLGSLRPSTEEEPGTLLLPSTRDSRFGTRELGTPFANKCRSAWGWTWNRDRGLWLPGETALEPIGLQEARHSFVTALVRAGYDVRLVQEWAGHAHPSTTLRVYAKERGRKADARALAEKMNQHLAAA
jgi:integrase